MINRIEKIVNNRKVQIGFILFMTLGVLLSVFIDLGIIRII